MKIRNRDVIIPPLPYWREIGGKLEVERLRMLFRWFPSTLLIIDRLGGVLGVCRPPTIDGKIGKRGQLSIQMSRGAEAKRDDFEIMVKDEGRREIDVLAKGRKGLGKRPLDGADRKRLGCYVIGIREPDRRFD